MEAEKIYVFNGARFIEHAHFEEFKDSVKTELGYSDDDAEELSDYYERYVEKIGNTRALNKVLFENIMYGRLTNIFLYKIKSPTSLGVDIFNKQITKIIDNFKGNVAIPTQAYMKSDGFYLMDILNVTTKGANFIAGFDFERKHDQITKFRFLVGKCITLKRTSKLTSGYMIGAIDIDFEQKTCVIMTKHTADVVDDSDDDSIKSPRGYNKFLIENFVKPFAIETETDLQKDREGMFEFCKSLYEKQINEVRELVRISAESDVKSVSRKLGRQLKQLGKKPTNNQINDLSKKIHNLILGIHIENNFTNADMAQKAIDEGLIGFVTNIEYQNSKMNRSATGTGQKDKTICKSENLYSLLTDFEKAQKLNKWSLTWFRDPQNPNAENTEQTSIESTTTCLSLRFKGRKNLGKELINHVTRTINSCRIY